MKRLFYLLPAFLSAFFACTREVPSDTADNRIVIQAGFEDMSGGASGTRTFVSGGTSVLWSDCDVDKVLYVFDSKGAKNVFTSEETGESAARSFSGTISEGSDVQWVLWSGKLAADDHSALVEESTTTEYFNGGFESIGSGGSIEFETRSGGTESRTVFGGSSLRVVNPQNISHTNSFAQDANITVMKPGDPALRSVFGYIRFTVPAGEGGHATIKSVTFSADEYMTGEIQIDYTGDEPVTRIVADGSRSLTVNTCFNGSGYETGTLYAVLPAGIYHHLTLTVTPFIGDAATQDAETGDPYTLSSKGEVVVCRGQFTDAGTISPALIHKPVLHLAGDSLCSEWPESVAPKTGWGQCLAAALGGDAQVVNRALSGYSTKSFIDNGKWQALIGGVRKGDLVLIMFAHNDGSNDTARHTDPGSTYDQNLVKFIRETREKDAIPVLLTSVSSRTFSNDGTTLYRTLPSYTNAMKKVASARGVALIDINEQTWQWFSELGPEGTVPYFVMDKLNPSAMDNTHLTRDGAAAVASMIAHGLKDLGLWKFAITE